MQDWLDFKVVLQLWILKTHFSPSFFFFPYLFSFIRLPIYSPCLIQPFSPIHYSFIHFYSSLCLSLNHFPLLLHFVHAFRLCTISCSCISAVLLKTKKTAMCMELKQSCLTAQILTLNERRLVWLQSFSASFLLFFSFASFPLCFRLAYTLCIKSFMGCTRHIEKDIVRLTCPALMLSQMRISLSVLISGALSFTSSTWIVTGTWLKRLGLSANGWIN